MKSFVGGDLSPCKSNGSSTKKVRRKSVMFDESNAEAAGKTFALLATQGRKGEPIGESDFKK